MRRFPNLTALVCVHHQANVQGCCQEIQQLISVTQAGGGGGFGGASAGAGAFGTPGGALQQSAGGC